MIDEKLVGTYWLCQGDKNRWIVQGGRPTYCGGNGFLANLTGYDKPMGWLCLDRDDSYTFKGTKKIVVSDFEGITFPTFLSPGDIVEIEVCKSGKVYWYEDSSNE